MFYAGADTRPDAVGRSLEAMLALLENTRTHGFDDEELSHATQRFLNTFVFRFDSPARIISERAVFDAFGYPEGYLQTYRERVSAVERGRQPTAAAQRLLHPGGVADRGGRSGRPRGGA